ncbi:hypothetical protein A2397_03270 [Candidatus Amesbacteria bacterium RIFOXYB1_FULL_44_23]|uniref:Nudix hydrolase domain-containing protein n=1 Tax=Candidatus Amesbacteria bacterium RIFOXYB1_FULL_44_23 TaxID=1797263 RepID=A0A1F4ZWI3_9BACT|nr:MAG: hypothetical protein A2397_03270 [Candidatus Amesbacteria bacterium RIFOXYB1_FULL_44_23]
MSEHLSVSQKAFITNSRWQVLLVKNPLSDPSHIIWDLPGSDLNFSQSLRDNLVQTVLKETGLTITTVSIPLNVTTYLDLANRQNQVVRIIYLCLAQGSPVQSKEMLWIDPAQFLHYPFPDEGYAKAFKNYLAHSRLASEEFLDRGILEHTTDYLRQKPPAPPFSPSIPLP